MTRQKPTNTTTRRHLLSIAACGAVAAAIPAATPTAALAVDPIYAAIEKHKAAAAVWDAAVGVRADFPDGPKPMTDEQWEERDRLDDAQKDAREPLVDAGVEPRHHRTNHAGLHHRGSKLYSKADAE